MSTDDPMSSSSAPLAGSSAAPSGPSRTLPINLFTHHSPDSIPSSTYLLPASWRRFQLSELINKVLTSASSADTDLEEPRAPVPFEFVIDGEVLRGSLEAWVKKNRAGDEERVVDVEYRRSLRVPQELGRREVEDWVSGLSLARPGYILLSSYLSHLQLIPLATFSSPSQPLTLPLPSLLGATCCAYISPPSVTSNIRVAAGGVDRQVHIFEIPSLSPDDLPYVSSASREIYTLHGHMAPISSIISGRAGKDVISSSWDGNLHLYVLPEEEPTEHQVDAGPVSFLPGQKKRRKVMRKDDVSGTVEGLNDGEVGEGGWRRIPDSVFRGHKGRIGGLVWDKREKERVWSAGWDGSVRGWELEMGAEGVVRVSQVSNGRKQAVVAGRWLAADPLCSRQAGMDKSMLCIDQFASTGTLVTGAMDRTICLWDTREATSLISLTIPTTSPVPSLKCHPTSQFTLAAATYSGQIQIWDVRSPKHAVFSVSKATNSAGAAGMEGGKKVREVTKNGKVLGERLLALDWDGERAVAGGEDGEVGLWEARGE